ncbi:unnamed protein product [Ixodes pacificus]
MPKKKNVENMRKTVLQLLANSKGLQESVKLVTPHDFIAPRLKLQWMQSHGGYPKHKSSLPIPISGNLGKGLAVGAGALAGAALLKKVNPLKPKKMFKHKHKHGWKGWSSSSSSSSSEEE